MNITASAPGKLLLMGEHAVVYGYPSLVTAIDQRFSVTLEETGVGEVVFDVPEGMDTRFIAKAVTMMETAWRVRFKGLTFHTKNGFSHTYGFGSSAAVVVAAIAAAAFYFGKNIAPKELFDLSYKTVLAVQGKGSGFDVAAAIFGGTLYFVTAGKIITPLPTKDMPLVVGYTGVKADTVTVVNEVGEKMKAQPERMNKIFDAITKLVEEGATNIRNGDWERVGRLMDVNQEYLRDLGVSSERLEALILAAKGAGAWGAKLSGAGRGDCMIAIVPKEKRKNVEEAIVKVGGQVIHTTPHAMGVRVES